MNAEASPAPLPAAATTPGPSIGVVITKLAELPEKTILDEAALAAALGVCKRTVRAMVGRYELPPPAPYAGRSCWMAGRILAHFEAQGERVAREAERAAEKFRKLT